MALLRQQPFDQGEKPGEVALLGPTGGLARDVALHPAEVGLEPLDLAVHALELAGMGIAAGALAGPLGEAGVALAQRDAPALGLAHQGVKRAQVEPGIAGMGDRLGLHRGVHGHALEAAWFDRSTLEPGAHRLGEEALHALGPDPCAPAGQRRGIDRGAACWKYSNPQNHCQ